MVFGKVHCGVFGSEYLLPDDCGDEILLPKHFIHQDSQVVHFMIINADANEPIFLQQLSSQEQARIHHGEPSRVIATTCLRVTSTVTAQCCSFCNRTSSVPVCG